MKISRPGAFDARMSPSKRMKKVSRIAAAVATRSCSTIRIWRGVRPVSRIMRGGFSLSYHCRRAQLYAICRQAQKRRGKGVAVPVQISRQPAQDAKTGLPLLALEPFGRHCGDRPAEAMALHQQFDRVAKAAIRFDGDAVDDAAREQAEAAGRIVRRQPRDIIEREGGGALAAKPLTIAPWAPRPRLST